LNPLTPAGYIVDDQLLTPFSHRCSDHLSFISFNPAGQMKGLGIYLFILQFGDHMTGWTAGELYFYFRQKQTK
jgi:hypothetical protein